MEPKQETRRYLSGTASIRAKRDGEDGASVVEGYALKWDDTYDIFDDGSLLESFERGAFAKTLENDNQALLVEHGGPALASTQNDTLTLTEDKVGLRFEAELDTRDPNAMGAMVRTENGTSTGVSVGFWIGDYERSETDDGDQRLVHTGVRHMFELSLVHNPAYTSSEVDVKRYRAILEKEADEVRQEEVRRDRIEDAKNIVSDMRVRKMKLAA